MTARTIDSIEKSIAAYTEGVSAFRSCSNGMSDTFSSHGSYVRPEFNRSHYESVRPSERVPVDFIESLTFCNNSYYNIAIVRNVIDLMADFCTKGITFSHRSKSVQSFYREWFTTINGKSVSERFCNYIFRLGNIAITKETSKISNKVATTWKKTKGEAFKSLDANKLVLPSSYDFLDVTALREEVNPQTLSSKTRTFTVSNSGGLISNFTNYNLTFRAQNPYSFSSTLYQSLPAYLKQRLIDNKGNLQLQEGSDIYIYHYRKDSWDTWARPFILAIAEPLIMLKKMHLADMAALDGVISNVRLWKLGYIDQTNVINSIIPSADILRKFEAMLRAGLAGGVLDIVWGPDIEFKESSSTSYNFLLPEKYQQLMSEIHDGLGVNPSLAGGSSAGGGGMTNNAISMKVLVERLSYARNLLVDFWTKEARLIQKAMGFATPAIIEFDDAIFSDEVSYKKLLIELYDRDIMSLEAVREEFNLVDTIESNRVLKETRRREKGTIPPKASNFHDPMVNTKLKSDLIKTGNLDGDHMNVDVKKEDVYSKNPGGRPVGTKDTTKRDPKRVAPKQVIASDFHTTQIWARESLEKISDILGDVYLQEKSKANFRQLTADETEEYEDLKLSVLCSLIPFSEVNDLSVAAALQNPAPIFLEKAARDILLKELTQKIDRVITMEDKRIAASAAYSISKLSE